MYKQETETLLLNAIANGVQSNKVHSFKQQKCKQTKIILHFTNNSRAAIPNNIATISLFSSSLYFVKVLHFLQRKKNMSK